MKWRKEEREMGRKERERNREERKKKRSKKEGRIKKLFDLIVAGKIKNREGKKIN